MEVHIKTCNTTYLRALVRVARATYTETFATVNTPENLQAYLNAAFHPDKLRRELAQPESAFYLVYADRQLAGYFKVNTGRAQTDVYDEAAIELERIYLLQRYQRLGLGSKILNQVMDIGRHQQKSFIWLGVWENNQAAIQFYTRHGFVKFGEHPFVMGDDHQTDHLMRRNL